MNPLMGGTATMPASVGLNMQAIQQAKKMMNAFKSIQNPQAAIMQMVQQNPQAAALLHMCKGRNPKDVFYEQCKAHGINADEIVKQLM